MTDVIGCVQLNLKAVRIKELERLLGIAAIEFQIERFQFCARLIRVEARDAEIIVIDFGGLTIALLNAKEAIADSQDVSGCRLLLQRHSEELLVELRCAVKVGYLYRDVVDTHCAEALLLRRRLRAGDQRREGKSELTAGQFAALETAEQCFYGLYHRILSSGPCLH